jgi:hypothetical protein
MTMRDGERNLNKSLLADNPPNKTASPKNQTTGMMGFQKGLAGQKSATNLQPPQNTLNKSIGGANSALK